jgi:hypothetical protein
MNETRKRRHGPAPKAAHELRQHSVSCRLTDAELALLDSRRGKVSRGEWLRRAAFGQPPRIVPELNKAAWSDLARVSANLNQLTRGINSGIFPVSDRPLVMNGLRDLRSQLDVVRGLLIGLEAADESED